MLIQFYIPDIIVECSIAGKRDNSDIVFEASAVVALVNRDGGGNNSSPKITKNVTGVLPRQKFCREWE